MQRYADSRREVYVHSDVTVDDLPITGEFTLPPVADPDENSFVPDNMENPKFYAGDVIAGVNDEEVDFVELIIEDLDDMISVAPLDRRLPRFIPDNIFSARIFQADRIHVFENIGEQVEDPDVEFDITKLETPEQNRPR